MSITAPRQPTRRWLRRWILAALCLIGLEWSLNLWAATRGHVAYDMGTSSIRWNHGHGCACVVIITSAAGRYPVDAIGDAMTYPVPMLRVTGHEVPGMYQGTTIIAIPFWLLSLVSGWGLMWCLVREGSMDWPWRWRWRRREVRGFEPVLRAASHGEPRFAQEPQRKSEFR